MDISEIDDEEYFAQLKLMFNTQGWEIFQSEPMENADLIGDLQNVSNEKDLYYKQGQLAAIGIMMNFQDTIKRAEEEGVPDNESTG